MTKQALKSHAYRDTASFGRRQEYIAAAELLKRGFDVYMTLVDDQGIDCIVRLDDQRYIDIQIKARSRSAKQWNRFAAMQFVPRASLFFIFLLEKSDRVWVIPSVHLAQLGRQNRTGENAGRTTVDLPRLLQGSCHERFKCYESPCGFELLRKYRIEKPAVARLPAQKV